MVKFQWEKAAPLQRGHLNLGGKNRKENIQVNSRYLEKNGQCWIPVMGEIHYVRLPRNRWRQALLKMKAGGITTVSTYVIWIYHEEEEEKFDFTGNRDLRYFLSLVKECGLKAVLRLGPWVHGEVKNGGFPDWLLEKGCGLRCDDPRYLSYVERFWKAALEQAKDFLFYKEGPVWAVQLENELTDNAPHIFTLKRLAKKIGFDVPVYTVTGWNAAYGAQIPEREVIPVFGGYAEAPWEGHNRRLQPSSHYFFLPDRNDSGIGNDLKEVKMDAIENTYHMKYDWYPFATCELGGGIQVTHHRRPVMCGDDMAAVALVALGSGNNLPGYYMYHGGLNGMGKHTSFQESKKSGYPNDLPVRDYDFQAPLGAYGQVREQYGKLRLFHLFLKYFGDNFGDMVPQFQETQITDRNDTRTLRCCVRANGDSGFVFVNNYQRLTDMPIHRKVEFCVKTTHGEMIFPQGGMNIQPGVYFFIPYHLNMNGRYLKYATAQLIAQKEETWFFLAIEGNSARYIFEDGESLEGDISDVCPKAVISRSGHKIVTLTRNQAEHFFDIDGWFYIAKGQMYGDKGTIFLYREGNPDVSFWKWEGDRFLEYRQKEDNISLHVSVCESHDETSEDLIGEEERKLSGLGMVKRWKIKIQGQKELMDQAARADEIFLEISYTGDIAQLYADGRLEADDFYRGVPWKVGIQSFLKEGRKLELCITEKTDDHVYLERGKSKGCSLEKVSLIPVYKKIWKEA